MPSSNLLPRRNPFGSLCGNQHGDTSLVLFSWRRLNGHAHGCYRRASRFRAFLRQALTSASCRSNPVGVRFLVGGACGWSIECQTTTKVPMRTIATRPEPTIRQRRLVNSHRTRHVTNRTLRITKMPKARNKTVPMIRAVNNFTVVDRTNLEKIRRRREIKIKKSAGNLEARQKRATL